MRGAKSAGGFRRRGESVDTRTEKGAAAYE